MSHHPSRAVLSGGAGDGRWEGLREEEAAPDWRAALAAVHGDDANGIHGWVGASVQRGLGVRGVRDPPQGPFPSAQWKVRMLRRALRFGTKDVTRTLVVPYTGRKGGAARPRHRARPTLGGAAQPGSPRRGPHPEGAVPVGPLLLGPWLISASPLLFAG